MKCTATGCLNSSPRLPSTSSAIALDAVVPLARVGRLPRLHHDRGDRDRSASKATAPAMRSCFVSRRRFGAGGDHETGPGAQTPSASKAGGGGGGGGRPAGARAGAAAGARCAGRTAGGGGRCGRRVRRCRKRGHRGRRRRRRRRTWFEGGHGPRIETGGACEPSGSMSAANEKLMSESRRLRSSARLPSPPRVSTRDRAD